MRTRFSYGKEILESTFWLTPTLVAVGVIALLLLVPLLQAFVPERLLSRAMAVQGSRLLLSSIVTATMTVVGVIFSVTIVVLQQVSQQYTPRVIENFIRSISNQFILGFYVGTFGYSLLLLRMIPEEQGAGPAEQIGTAVAILLALTCVALLIYFIHHLVKSIKSNNIVASITRQSVGCIDALMEDVARQTRCDAASMDEQTLAHDRTITAGKNGYLQELNWQRLPRILDGTVWSAYIRVIPGDYVYAASALVQIKSSRPLTPKQQESIAELFAIALARTHSQDIRYGIRQMVDIALRALSPGINDPSTAVECLNEIGTVLLHYTARCQSSSVVQFANGSCLHLKEPTYSDFLGLCFNEIAVAGRDFYVVQECIHYIIDHVEGTTQDTERAQLLRHKREQLQREVGPVPGAALYR